MKYLIMQKKFAEELIKKVGESGYFLFTSFAVQTKHRKRIVMDGTTVEGRWVRNPRMFFCPFIRGKAWTKLCSKVLNEVSQAGFLEYDRGGWIRVKATSGWHLSDSETEAQAEDNYAFNVDEIMNKLE